jgi:hypothetical protein
MTNETLEEAAERLQKDKYGIFISKDAEVKGQLVIDTARAAFLSGMTEGAKWQAERMYTLEQISKDFIGEEGQSGYFDDWLDYRLDSKNKLSFREWFEQFKKK